MSENPYAAPKQQDPKPRNRDIYKIYDGPWLYFAMGLTIIGFCLSFAPESWFAFMIDQTPVKRGFFPVFLILFRWVAAFLIVVLICYCRLAKIINGQNGLEKDIDR